MQNLHGETTILSKVRANNDAAAHPGGQVCVILVALHKAVTSRVTSRNLLYS